MVQQKIKQVVETIPELHYMFVDWATANLSLDFASNALPAFIHLLPVNGELNMKNSIIRDYPECFFAFFDIAYIESKDEPNEPTVERMKELARRFIVAINNSGLFESVSGDFTYTAFYEYLDQNVTGIMLTLKLKELEGVCYR